MVLIPAGASTVRHVLEHVEITVINTRGDDAIIPLNVQVFDGATQVFSWPLYTAAGPTTQKFDVADFDQDILRIGTPGTSMQVGIDNNGANILEALSITGHDV